jgi:hypothetical protein
MVAPTLLLLGKAGHGFGTTVADKKYTREEIKRK